MDSTLTPQLSPEILTALSNLVTLWNADSISQNNSLVITGNQISILDTEDTTIVLQFSTETNPAQEENTDPPPYNELDIPEEFLESNRSNEINEEMNQLFSSYSTNENASLENILEQDAEEISSSTTNSRNIDLDNIVDQIQRDLVEDSNEEPIRINPLSSTTWQNQIEEIIKRLKQGTKGKNRIKQIRHLEACYYLEQVRLDQRNNLHALSNISELLRNALGNHKAHSTSLTAKRLMKILELNG